MNDEFYMDFALKLAQVSDGQTSPNPTVGAVVVKDGEIIGFGSHLKAGFPHAEINALKMAGDRAEGSTIYVTLEPCSHHGKTPPCANALIESRVHRVVIGSMDPNPLVAGKGIGLLRDAGIEVKTGVLKEKADELNKAFFHFIQHKKPFVTLKQAITLDGKIAAEAGKDQKITGKEVQEDVHLDRERHDAILVGIGTVLSDNPLLTNRYGKTKKQPIRIILDTHLKITPDKKVITDTKSKTWIFTGSDVEKDRITNFTQSHVEIIQLSNSSIEIDEVLAILGKRQVSKLYVEGGKTINASFLKSGYVNQLITYVAPKIIGGNSAVPMFGDLNVKEMPAAYGLTYQNVEVIGEDLKITSVLK
ncbi:bifunctional diaminohydroxyphosphoribosylaminopyrimidine deaminase/5-amino-6-(5-phosphoribosylamino)uracil reductase RibD [Lederbergia wuyishanensis]|uniref:Riboflavin biosynthesis protein RibD n=1 Tax=Lederbergia wuyishanensis TaxID=1347903 RepID=A0ABU0D6I0_9BACI|nr:bifunctional diaminohydroxyphosphoribosylaminopyrimidine deaminase/5-amino-6-(5-phosphoribosylamino)uracil reductase RibD [Lederbergia wuyishanensis]MCJ8008604.1 bifunctional diaminohydroxyphosphoribosylaminopyrimidine deaminase/5-amino-6-(5-phosphoribosylamino)uracil reductase RibD [Lederbergia wuyishanensis]MDQ0343980.1 diaminohydroxyphosphoribosylaminopyrimidine deaminase/5-amino-6-(5-phosphoribosylamino)uracil reductase [Lederbergia wuyishanensis]